MSPTNPTTPLNPTYRLARHEDQPAIAEMVRDLWEGNDYLPKQWPRWVEEPRSELIVGEEEGSIVSAGRAIELRPGAWWLEGLRVHPELQGLGLGRHLFDELMARARAKPGAREVGYTTSDGNPTMQHLAETSGMRMAGSYRLLRSPLEAAPPEAPAPSPARGDAVTWLARLHEGAWLRQTGGYVMEGWVARAVDEAFVAERLAAGALWELGGAVALLGGGSHNDQSWLYALDGGDVAARAALARAAWAAGVGPLRCFAPRDDALQAPLFAAGLADAWDDEPFHCHHYVRTVDVMR